MNIFILIIAIWFIIGMGNFHLIMDKETKEEMLSEHLRLILFLIISPVVTLFVLGKRIFKH